MPNTTIKVIKQGKGAAVGKDNEDIILLTGSMYGGGDLNENTAIVARSELGSGLFCAKETSLANTCAGWLKSLKETLGEEITFYISGKPSEHHEQELQVLCEQEGIQAKIFIKQTPSSLTLAANYTEILYQQDLTELTGCYLFSYSLSQEIQKAIKQLNERIEKPGFFSDTAGRKKSVEELGGLQELIEGAGKKHLRPLDFDFSEHLKKELKEYRSKYLGRQDTDTVSNLLKKIDEIFSTQTFTKTKFSLPMPPTTATWYDAPPPASPKLSESNTEELPLPPPPNIAEELPPATEIEATPTPPPSPAPIEVKTTVIPPPPPPAHAKPDLAELKAKIAPATEASQSVAQLREKFATLSKAPAAPTTNYNGDHSSNFNNDMPLPPPPPMGDGNEQSQYVFEDSPLPPPPPIDPTTTLATEKKDITPEMQSIMARRGAIGGPDSDSETEAGEDDSWPNQSPSTLFQRQQSQSQEADNSNPLQYN
ncbi:hypothetical protein ACGP04_08485 [Piscirickettsia salmonis]|uniref:hypothetical protein n=1 Tax=Piscirickettsia salmonis TaxID=1238 RepID=UPI000F08203B|nr:hypothetical protein DA717_13315 [Piscirickettsiaceae bacterium NZ-RLO2]